MSDLFLGIMSGTSLDGIDVAISSFANTQITLSGFYSAEWPASLRDTLMELATAERVSMNALTRTHFQLAKEYALAVEAALREAVIPATNIRAIGLHGQTVRHLPSAPTPATLQLGSGAALAAITGIDVVSDFRAADMAVGGQGAPLVPMFDYRFLRSNSLDRLIVNIGGIANVTWLPRNAREEDVIAFDSGPGNMLLDSIARQYFDLPFDQNGELANSGQIDEAVLSELLSHPYFKTAPPKSTGRELFSQHFLSAINQKITDGNLSPNDALATLTEFTARSVAQSLEFVNAKSDNMEIIVSGGGAFNEFLLNRISANAPNAHVRTSDAYGIAPKAKEAIAFAYFAKAFIEQIPIHLPATTGARRRVTLGSLSRG
ncbi:MAG TPA: anhydro-N-acetylmuramic acid kinase [Candidatus Kapabacteria bacterium]|nr:anhydro-N-acetylmuramic acid kinase [Candidatus Kapabacteria bacterium]